MSPFPLRGENIYSLHNRRENLSRALVANSRKPGMDAAIEQQTAEIRAITQELARRGEVERPELRAAFTAWLRSGMDALPAHYKDIMLERRATIASEGAPTGGAYPGSTAGFFAPLEYQNKITAAMKYAGPFPDVATTYHTKTGAPIGLPGQNDTSVIGAFVAEGAQASQVDLTQNLVSLGSFKASSGITVMSMEELQDVDVAPGLEEFIAAFHGVRLGRLLNQQATIGAGSGSAPTGFLTSIGSAAVTIQGANVNDGVSNSHNSIGTADLTALQQAVDFAYQNESSCWQVHPTVLASMRGQLDKQGRLLWPLLQNDVPLLNGFLVKPNAYLDTYPTTAGSPAVSYPVVAFGDWSKFKIRIAPLLVLRFTELPGYVEYGKVGFATHMRFDCNVVDGGGGAIKYAAVVY